MQQPHSDQAAKPEAELNIAGKLARDLFIQKSR